MFSQDLKKNTSAEEINSENLKTLRYIVRALNLGVFFFLLVTLLIYYLNHDKPAEENQDPDFLNILLVLVLVVTIVQVILSRIIPSRIFAKKDINFLSAVRTYYIIKLAMLEGAAFLGLVLLILAVTRGFIYNFPVYWLSLIPVIIFFFISFITFPTVERIKELQIEKMQ